MTSSDNGRDEQWHLPAWNKAWDGPATACGLAGNGGISVLNEGVAVTDTTNLCPKCVEAARTQAGLAQRYQKHLTRPGVDWHDTDTFEAQWLNDWDALAAGPTASQRRRNDRPVDRISMV